MPLKPWYKVVTPREDLREGKPLDASEFAVHLDQVRQGNAPADYQKPERFFERTYLTKNLASLASEVIRQFLPKDKPSLTLTSPLILTVGTGTTGQHSNLAKGLGNRLRQLPTAPAG